MKKIAILLAFIAILFQCQKERDNLLIATVSGIVLDSNNWHPIPEVMVSLYPSLKVAYTDADGRFSFQEIQNGTYTIKVYHSKYHSISDTIKVANGFDISLEMKIKKYDISFQTSSKELHFGTEFDTLPLVISNLGLDTLHWAISTLSPFLKFSKQKGNLLSASDSLLVYLQRDLLSVGVDSAKFLLNTNGGREEVLCTWQVIESGIVANFTIIPDIGNVRTSFTVDASQSSNLPGGELQYRWQWESDSAFGEYGNQKIVTHRYSTTGIKHVSLIVKNLLEETKTVSKTITVLENQPPTAHIFVNQSIGDVGSTFECNANNCTDDFDAPNTLQVKWIFDSPADSTDWTTTKSISRTYTSSGSKNITLQVKDSFDSISTLFTEVHVTQSESGGNDTINTNVTIPEVSIIMGTIGYDNDTADWYTIQFPDYGFWVVSILNRTPPDTPNGFIGEVKLYNADLQEIGHIGTDYIAPSSDFYSEIISVVPLQFYYIKVPKYQNSTATYQLESNFYR